VQKLISEKNITYTLKGNCDDKIEKCIIRKRKKGRRWKIAGIVVGDVA
jgi:hypothetical protein